MSLQQFKKPGSTHWWSCNSKFSCFNGKALNALQKCFPQCMKDWYKYIEPWLVLCLLHVVSSDYTQPITGQATEVTCPVIDWTQPELTPSKRQRTGPGLAENKNLSNLQLTSSWLLITSWNLITTKNKLFIIKCMVADDLTICHDDVIKWKHFPRHWPLVQGIHRSLANSPHKGQWHWALMISLICTWINCGVNNHKAGDLRRHRAHYDVTVMWSYGVIREGMTLQKYFIFCTGRINARANNISIVDIWHLLIESGHLKYAIKANLFQ